MNNAAPGWYPDPKDPSAVRWFDGRFWTEHYGPASTGQVPPAVEPVRRAPRTGLLIAGGIAAGTVVVALMVAAAIPVYREQHDRGNVGSVTTMTCDDVADEAIQLAAVEKDLDPLASVTGAAVARDARDIVRLPAPGAEAFVMSCSAMGTRPDGSSGPVTIDLYIDHERTHLLWYTWDT